MRGLESFAASNSMLNRSSHCCWAELLLRLPMMPGKNRWPMEHDSFCTKNRKKNGWNGILNYQFYPTADPARSAIRPRVFPKINPSNNQRSPSQTFARTRLIFTPSAHGGKFGSVKSVMDFQVVSLEPRAEIAKEIHVPTFGNSIQISAE